jgi:hypothetical protein
MRRHLPLCAHSRRENRGGTGGISSPGRGGAPAWCPQVCPSMCSCRVAGTMGVGTYGACARAGRGVCANLRGGVAELRRCAARAPSRVPHLASVGTTPGMRRASWQCRWLFVNTLPRREASDSSVGRRPPAALSAEEAVQARGCAWVRGVRSAPAGAHGWGASRQDIRRHARGARRGGARGRRWAESGSRRSSRWVGEVALAQAQCSSHAPRRRCECIGHPEARLGSEWRAPRVRDGAPRRGARGR